MCISTFGLLPRLITFLDCVKKSMQSKKLGISPGTNIGNELANAPRRICLGTLLARGVLALKDVSWVPDLSMLLVVAVPTHSDWLSILYGCTGAVIARHFGLVHLAVFSRTDFLRTATLSIT